METLSVINKHYQPTTIYYHQKKMDPFGFTRKRAVELRPKFKSDTSVIQIQKEVLYWNKTSFRTVPTWYSQPFTLGAIPRKHTCEHKMAVGPLDFLCVHGCRNTEVLQRYWEFSDRNSSNCYLWSLEKSSYRRLFQVIKRFSQSWLEGNSNDHINTYETKAFNSRYIECLHTNALWTPEHKNTFGSTEFIYATLKVRARP